MLLYRRLIRRMRPRIWSLKGSVRKVGAVASGMASGAVAVCIGTPFDVALVRMQSDSMLPMEQRKKYKNVFDALIRMTKEVMHNI